MVELFVFVRLDTARRDVEIDLRVDKIYFKLNLTHARPALSSEGILPEKADFISKVIGRFEGVAGDQSS